jgi:hypothetical protein
LLTDENEDLVMGIAEQHRYGQRLHNNNNETVVNVANGASTRAKNTRLVQLRELYPFEHTKFTHKDDHDEPSGEI